jgi:Ig-like domain CHU_C associated/GEVED domain/SprB repeat
MVKNYYFNYFLPLFLRTLVSLRGAFVFSSSPSMKFNLINNNLMTNNYNKRWSPHLKTMSWLRVLILLLGTGLGLNPLFAQTTVTIGTGTLTASGTNGTPIYRSSGTSAFHHSKSIQLLTATDLATAGIPSGAVINSWAYNKTTAATISGANSWTLNVYLKNSSATALATGTAWNTMISGATLAYTNTITSANIPAVAGYWAWPVTGFVYTGGAIECYVEWFPAGTMVTPFTSAAFPWQYTATAGAQAMGTSNSVAIPGTQAAWTTQARFYNTQISYSPGAADDLGLQATAVPSGNGSICNGASQNVSVTLRNNGTNPVDFSVTPVDINGSVTGPNPTSFSTVTLNSGILAPGATQVVTLATGYNASLSGSYGFSANLTWAPDGFATNNTFNWSATNAFNVTASSNVYTFCDGTSPQLNTASTVGYSVQSIPHVPITPPGSPSAGPAGDDAQAAATIPFAFTFNGVAYTTLNIYTNGFVQFGTSSGSTTTYGATIPTAAAPNNIVALAWEDLLVNSPATITYWTDGVAPNRKFVVSYNSVGFYNAGTPIGNVTGQIVLNEVDNTIDVFLTNIVQSANSSVCGIENAAGTSGVVAPGRQFGTWGAGTVTNEGWKFFVPTLSYAWSPATGLSSSTIANPVATLAPATSQTYTVSVTDPTSGCVVSDTVLLSNLGAGDAAPTTTGDSKCAGDSAFLSAAGTSTLNWYTAAIGGTLVHTGANWDSIWTATTTYYVESFNGICPSARTPVTVTVTPQPTLNVTATPSVLCLGATSQLAANNFISGNLVSTTAAGNGASGNVFTISNVNGTSPIRIDSLSMGITAGTLAEVWYLPSAYTCGTSPSNAGWTQVGQVAITPAGASPALTIIPLYINVTIPVGQTYSFAVACNGSNYYTDGTVECNVASSDANISIAQGRGGAITAGVFNFPNSPRIWNGRVYYSFGDPNLTFDWQPSATLNSNSIANPVATPTATTTYVLTATNLAGCETVDSATVTVNPLPIDAVIDSVTNVFCGCGQAVLHATLGTVGSQIRWFDSAVGGTQIGTGTPFTTPYACGVQTYYAETYDPITGCVQAGPRASFTITPATAPSISVAATDLILCDGEPASQITVTTANVDYTFAWSPAAGLDVTTGSVVNALPSSTTTYTVTATDTVTGCINAANVTIGVGLTPIISGATASPSVICQGSSSQLQVTALASGSVPPEPSGYCAYVVPTSPGVTGDFISNVTFNTLNNTSGEETDDYEQYPATGSTTTSVSAGSTYTLTVTTDPGFGQGKGVYIDWNRDAIFDASEAVMLSASGTTPVSINVTVPLTAIQGQTKMRVICWFANTATLANACTAGSIGFGETEDYTITILSGGALTYSWSPAGSLNNANILNPVATPTVSENYTVTVTDAAGCSASTSVPVTVVAPPAAPVVTNDTVCGQGNANLLASGSGGTLIWMDTIAGPIINTGGTYSPYVSTSQTYYVVEDQGGANVNVGLSATAAGTTAFASATANYQTFNVLNPAGLIIRTVDIVPNAATPLGTAVAIQLEDAAGNALGSPVSTVTTTQGTVQTITLNMFVPQGTAYRLRPVSNPNLQYHQNGFSNPYTLPGQLSITGWGAPNATTLYVFFYNWSVTVFDGVGSGCYSAPSIVSAVVNAAPALNITPGSTPSYCNTGSVVLNATGDPSWVNFNWSPATGLSGTTGNTVTANPTSTTTYILTADDGVSGGCVDTASITVTVNSGPTVTIDPAPYDSLCNGSSFAINATAGSSSFKTIGFGTNSADNTIAVYDGNNTSVKTQILYTAAELNAAGLIGPGNITSIAFNVVNKLSTGSLNGFSISMANTSTVAPLTTAYVAGTFTTVFSGSVTTTLGWNQHNFTTPFLWDGVSNVLVEVCNGTPTVPGFDQIQNTPTASAMTIQANLLGCTSTTGNPILNRPNTRFTGGEVLYIWSPSSELSSITIEDPTFTATSTGAKNYVLTVIDPSNGCEATANLDFVISDVPKVASVAAITNTDVCVSATVSMRAFGTNAAYQWQTSSDGINFTDLSGETNDTLTQSVSVDTWFRVKSVCVDSSFSSILLYDVSNPVLSSVENDTVCGQGITTLVGTPGAGFFAAWYDSQTGGNFIQNGDTLVNYLTATDTFWVAAAVAPIPVPNPMPTGYPANTAGSTIDEDIDAVTIGTLVNNQATAGCALYTDYTGLTAPTLAPGSVVPFSITIGDCENAGFFSSGTSLFIDFNRDADFADAGEQVFTTSVTTNGIHTLTGTFTVPVTASLGITRARIINAEGIASPVFNQAYTYGETEDYAVNIGFEVCQTARVPVIAVVTVPPVLDVTPASASVCEGGSVNLDVTTGLSDFTTFSWAPATDLNTTSGPNVIATPTASITYVVTASGNASGCIATDTAVVTVNANPVIAVSTTTPNLCGGDTAQIVVDVISPVAGNYNVSSIAYAPYAGALTQSAAALGDEGNQSVTLPFAFNFAGTNYTDVTIHANGQILMGAGNTSADFQYSPPTIFTAAAPNEWIGLWSDLNVALAGSITYDIVGVAPNRKLVVRFDNVDYYFATPSISYQIELNETSNAVDIFLTNIPNTSFNTRAVGMETATQGFVAPGRNTGTWTATNEAWRFAPEAAPTISWSGANIIGSTSADTIYATPTVSGYYAVTVTNSQTGCFYTDSVQINFALTPKPVIADNDTSLCSPNFIYVNVVDTGIYSGGYPTGTTFEWLSVGGQIVPPTPDLDSIPSTFGSTYFAIVTLGNGCSAMSDTATILTKAVAVVDTITAASCVGGGSILATVTSGIAPYQYVWSTDLAQTNIIQTTNTSSTQDLLSGLAAGTYYLSVSDEFGTPGSCNSGVIAYTVGGSSPIVATATGTDISCNGFGDGSATVSWTGGTAPFSILWSDGNTNATRAVLTASTLTVIVSDLSGCADTASVTINEPAAISLSLSSTNESAPGASDGTATVVISGGTPGYTVAWFDGLFAPVTTGNPATGLTADTYTCLVTDTNGCQGFDIVTVSTNTNATLNLTMLIEGMYDGAGGLVPALLNSGVGLSTTECDTILVEIRDQVSPTTVLASGTAVLGTNGQASFTFPAAINGATGYIAIFHRNAVQTWSDLVTFSATTNYNFTTAGTQAYAGNQKEVTPGVWAFYSGDITPQDELIDVTDQGLIDNDIFNFVSGYAVTDITGDGLVDVTDQGIVDNNIFNFIGSIHP